MTDLPHTQQSQPRILAIAPQPFYTPRGTPLSVYYRTLIMSQAGASIDLLTYGVGHDVDIPGVRIIRIPSFGCRQIKIGPSLTKAFLDIFMVLYTIALLLRRRYTVVHAHEESVFWCRFLKPLFGFRLIYDMHSSLPQQLTNFSFTTSRVLIGAFDRLERTCLRSADAVITICPDLAEYALAHGADAGRHFLIENSIFDAVRLRTPPQGGDDDAAATSARALPPLHSSNRRIMYAGTFEPYQGIDLLLRAYAHITDDCDDVELLLIGGSPEQVAQMKRLADELKISARCTFTGTLPKAQAMEYSRHATLLISPRVRGTNTPLKVYEQLASGVPLLATRIWSHTQVLSDDVCVLVEPEPRAMAEGLRRALTDEPLRQRLVAAARRLYDQRYSRNVYESKIDAVLQCIAQRGRSGRDSAPARDAPLLSRHGAA